MNKLNKLYKFEDMSNEDVLLNNGFQNVNQLIDYSNGLKEENERLNNIINKIREYAKNDDNFIILDVYSQDTVYGIQEDILNIVGSDKE
jgi:hypothetical protein